MKKYSVVIIFTERTKGVSDQVVFANNDDDARLAARMQFLSKRRDEPTIDDVRITDSTGEKP